MLKIVLAVDAPPGQAIGVKEAIAMELERYGDVRVVEVTEVAHEQLTFPNYPHKSTQMRRKNNVKR